MTNWKTTLSAAGAGIMGLLTVVAAAPADLANFFPVVSPKWRALVLAVSALSTFALHLINGFWQKDKDVTGGERPNTMELFPILTGLGFAMLFGGCATHAPKPVPHIAPSSAAVKSDVGRASDAVKEARGGIGRAKDDATSARDEARVIIGELPDDLKPKVAALEMRLNMVLRDLEDADQRAVTAEMTLTQAEGHIGELQQNIERQTELLDRESSARLTAETELSKAKADLRHQTWLAWKWRLLSFAIGIAALAWIFKGPLLGIASRFAI